MKMLRVSELSWISAEEQSIKGGDGVGVARENHELYTMKLGDWKEGQQRK